MDHGEIDHGSVSYGWVGHARCNLINIMKRCLQLLINRFPGIYLSHGFKGTVILNAGYRGGRIFYTNGKSFLPHSPNSMKFDTPIQHSKKLYTPLLSAWIILTQNESNWNNWKNHQNIESSSLLQITSFLPNEHSRNR